MSSHDGGAGATTALVTGAFGNTGAAIAELLAQHGRRLRTLTNRPAPPGSTVDVRPFDVDDRAGLAAAFAGVDEFYNTFWMRTGDGSGYDEAVRRSAALFEAAAAGGVRRIVHLSVLRADEGERYPYFRAKAHVERLLRETEVPHAIVRPAVIFGGAAALVDELARVLRRSPMMPIPDGGRFRVRPVHVDDVARLCVDVDAALDAAPIDAVGPERPTYRELVEQVKRAVRSRALLVPVPARLVVTGATLLARITGRPLLTEEELDSTIEGLADSDGPATGERKLSEWLDAHGDELGRGTRNAGDGQG